MTRSFHGREFVDNYEWLRDKESQETLDYLNAENDYTKAKTAHLDEMTENIFQEIKSRIKQTDMSVPSRRGDYWYYGRTEEGKSYGYSCRLPVEEGLTHGRPRLSQRKAPRKARRLSLTPTRWRKARTFALGAASISDSGRYLAYSVDFAGDERFELYIKDLESGALLDDHLKGIFYGATWAGDGYIFYTTVDEAWRPDAIWRHKVGTAQSEDVRVFKKTTSTSTSASAALAPISTSSLV